MAVNLNQSSVAKEQQTVILCRGSSLFPITASVNLKRRSPSNDSLPHFWRIKGVSKICSRGFKVFGAEMKALRPTVLAATNNPTEVYLR